jgi:hypothetical protein
MICAAEPLSKFCSYCGRTLPIDEFRFRKRGEPTRQGSCRECYNRRMRLHRLGRRLKAIRGFSSQVLRANGPPALSRICAGMLCRFGGVDGFCREWIAHIHAAPVGSPTALSAFSAFFRLMAVADAQQQVDYSALSDEELDREIQQHVGGRT